MIITAQRTQGIEYFDSFNTSTSKQKLYSAWFCLRRGKKYIKQLWQIDATTLQTHVTT